MTTTEELVRRWRQAQESVKHAESSLNSARCDLLNAQNALGKHLDPGDQEPHETLSVWARLGDHQEALVVSTKGRNSDYAIALRGKPRKEVAGG